MRIAKPLLMISMSVFLLAVSWSLLTGQLGLPGPAHAQVASPFVSISGLGETGYTIALTEDGQAWSFLFNGTAGSWSRVSYLGQFGAGPIPTTDESASGLKSSYGGN